ncbi:MAG: hypothetical protein KC613_01515 [Myxococcales bacterium]|nr:hypothetical protein [Myxococcales bacterium]MCB9526482.1 hypothetical protein [Myxococcales bacterium]
MPIEGAQALGEWESFPHRLDRRDADTLGLPEDEAIIYDLVDGRHTIEQVCARSGLQQNEALGVLFSLLGQGLIAITGTAATADTPSPAALPANDGPARLEVLPFRGVSPPDVQFLKGYGPLGYVPGLPTREPGRDRYGRFPFDNRALLMRCGLTVAQKKEVIFLSQMLPRLDHFEFFDMDEPTDDRRELKKAFFIFTKKYHPDARRTLDMGPFEPYVAYIYRHAAEVSELLQSDDRFRATYARAVKARNRAYREGLESLREERESVQRQDRLREAKDRKAEIQKRLERNAKARRLVSRGPEMERLNKAERFHRDGMLHYEQGDLTTAANLLRLAVTYDPRNRVYEQAFERADRESKSELAGRYWERGETEQSVGRSEEAIAAYTRAVELAQDPAHAAHLARYMVDNKKDLRTAMAHAELAVARAPQNVDYLVLLAKIQESADLSTKARATLERAKVLDGSREDVKQALNALKKK